MTLAEFYAQEKQRQDKQLIFWKILLGGLILFLIGEGVFAESNQFIAFCLVLAPIVLFAIIRLIIGNKVYVPKVEIGDTVAYKNGFVFEESMQEVFKVEKIDIPTRRALLKHATKSSYQEVFIYELESMYKKIQLN